MNILGLISQLIGIKTLRLTNSIGGSHDFVVFVDDYSRYSLVFLMCSRDELLNIS